MRLKLIVENTIKKQQTFELEFEAIAQMNSSLIRNI